MKICTKCKKILPFSSFNKRIDSKNGIRSHCKKCCVTLRHNEYMKLYYKTEKYRLSREKYRTTINYTINQRRYSRTEKRRTGAKIYYKNRIKVDIQFKLQKLLRSRLGKVISRNQKKGSAVNDLGCTLEFFKKYIEDKFTVGMNWNNHGLFGWHIDHIKPLSKFDLTKKEEFLKACNYKNMQPLWCIDNLKKNNKYVDNLSTCNDYRK